MAQKTMEQCHGDTFDDGVRVILVSSERFAPQADPIRRDSAMT
jgi:hypothetical protein